VDGAARTYTAVANNYQTSYRLKSVDGYAPLVVPRGGVFDEDQFRLCFSCHESTPFLSSNNTDTNFRSDVNNCCVDLNPPANRHWFHLQAITFFRNKLDSDWDGGGTDHDLADGDIIISAGSLTGTTTFNVTDDGFDEGTETVIVTLGTPVNATKDEIDEQTINILDNDATVDVSFTSAGQTTVDESGTVTITAELSAVSGLYVTIPSTANEASTAAGSGLDYSITESPVVIYAGDTTVDITITIAEDSLDEDNETVTIDMGTPANANQGLTTSHTTTITDDDAEPTVTFTSANQATVDESGAATITVELSAARGR